MSTPFPRGTFRDVPPAEPRQPCKTVQVEKLLGKYDSTYEIPVSEIPKGTTHIVRISNRYGEDECMAFMRYTDEPNPNYSHELMIYREEIVKYEKVKSQWDIAQAEADKRTSDYCLQKDHEEYLRLKQKLGYT